MSDDKAPVSASAFIDTPRTDAEHARLLSLEYGDDVNGWEVAFLLMRDFARTLERELSTRSATAAHRHGKTTCEEMESMYHKIVMVALDCDPIAASERADDQLEPPWEVFARIKRERDELIELLRDARHAADLGYHGGISHHPECKDCEIANRIIAVVNSADRTGAKT